MAFGFGKKAKEELKEVPLKVVFACEAGMGSSAMGASLLRDKMKKAGLKLNVKNYAVNSIPQDVDLVVTHKSLVGSVKLQVPNVRVVAVENFLGSPEYDKLVDEFSSL
jgi:PTS system mannitol-specific IIC component